MRSVPGPGVLAELAAPGLGHHESLLDTTEEPMNTASNPPVGQRLRTLCAALLELAEDPEVGYETAATLRALVGQAEPDPVDEPEPRGEVVGIETDEGVAWYSLSDESHGGDQS